MGHHAGKPPIPLHRPVTVVGSRSTARIHLMSSTVSKAHALIVHSGGRTYIRDLASRTHLYVNGEQTKEVELEDGDQIKIGSFTFAFKQGPRRPSQPVPPLPQAELEVTGGDFPLPIDQRVMLIGRRSVVDIPLLEESVSTAHAVLFEMDGERYVRDLGSRTGTFVNGAAIHQHKLSPGDVIRVGETDIRYSAASEAPAIDLPLSGDSAAAYALEAPTEELAPSEPGAPGAEHDTMGGLDLLGAVVKEKTAPYVSARQEQREPARGQPEPLPLEPLSADDLHDDADAQRDEPAEVAAEHRRSPSAAASADIEDLASELLADEAPAAESLSPLAPAADTTARASDATDEAPARDDAPALEPAVADQATSEDEEPAGEAIPLSDEAELHPRRGWRPTRIAAEIESPDDADGDADAHMAPESEAQVHRGPEPLEVADAPLAAEAEPEPEPAPEPEPVAEQDEVVAVSADAAEPHQPTAQQTDEPKEVLRFNEPTSSDRDDTGVAVLDQDALESSGPEAEPVRFELDLPPVAASDSPAEHDATRLAPLHLELDEPAAVEPMGLDAPAAAAPGEISIDFTPDQEAARSNELVDLGSVAEAPDQPAPLLDLNLADKSAAAESVAPELNLEPPPPLEIATPLEDLAPPALPPLELDEAALLPLEPVKPPRARRPRQIKPPVPIFDTPPPAAAPPPPPVPIEPAEATEPVEVLDQTEPTPESALGDLDQATQPLDESAIADALQDQPAAAATPGADTARAEPMTDSLFGRAVEELTASTTTGELVEAHADAGATKDQTVEVEPVASRQTPRKSDDVDRFDALIDMELPSLDEAHSILPERANSAAAAVPPMELPELEPVEPVAEAPAMAPQPQQPAAPATEPFTIGANQENFLGGIPLPRPKLPPRKSAPAAGDPGDAPAAPGRRAGPVDPVEALISEIDSAAAAAERAGARDPASPWVQIAPPGGARSARRSPRQGEPAAGEAAAPAAARMRPLDELIPPFVPGDVPATAGGVTLGFDGLAMPPVREMDVFAQTSPPAAARDPDEQSSSPDAPTIQRVTTPMDMTGIDAPPAPQSPAASPDAKSRRPRTPVPRPIATPTYHAPPDTFFGGTSETEGSGDADELDPERHAVRPAIPGAFAEPARHPPVMYAAEESEAAAAAELRRQRLRRVPVLFGSMFALIVLTVAGIYWLMPVRSTIEATLTFANLEARSKRDRDQFIDHQRRLLVADTTRKDARRRLWAIDSETPPGFFEDPIEYAKVIDRTFWPETRKNALVISVQGTPSDATRLRALLLTLYDANKVLLDSAAGYKRSLQDTEEEIARAQRRLDQLKAEKETLRIKGEQAPSPQQMKAMESEVGRLLEQWNQAIAATKRAEIELKQMKESPGSGTAGGASSTDAIAALAAKDNELQNMQKELDALTVRAEDERLANANRVEAARTALDGAMASFQTEIATASESNQGNPELMAYVASAQKLQENTRRLIDDLFSRQENQFRQLMELKERLNEKMDGRRNEMWQADKELQGLTQRLAILTRQYNAAVGSGLQREADDAAAEIDLTKNLIRARQDLIPGDAFYAEAIQQLQLIIDNTKKNIDEDRARTDQLVEQLQKSFISAPTPGEQKELAALLGKRLEAINDARRAYNAAVDAGAADIDPQLKMQIATLQAGIDARRQQLAEAAQKQHQGKVAADHAAAIAVKQTEVESLKDAEQTAESAYLAKNKEMRDAQLAAADARSVAERINEVINQQGALEEQLKVLVNSLEAKKRDAATAIEPVKPDDNDVIARDGIDRRPLFAGASSAALFVIFATMIMWTWHAAAREVPPVQLAASDISPIPLAQSSVASRASTNGNGSIKGAEEDHEPAIV